MAVQAKVELGQQLSEEGWIGAQSETARIRDRKKVPGGLVQGRIKEWEVMSDDSNDSN